VSFPIYSGKGRTPGDRPGVTMEHSMHSTLVEPAGYVPDKGLVDAVNVALLLRQPLLLTGEPGTGKTQLGYHMAWELGLPKPLRYDTKSTSTARDLFYSYDVVGRFHGHQTGSQTQSPWDYLTFNALGEAILHGMSPAKAASTLPPEVAQRISNRETADGSSPSLVIIDEVDKAPRDFPNDILNELEEMMFRVPEIENCRIGDAGDPDTQRPVLIITSNSEKHLPDAFLRRCIYYDIPFPPRETLEQIIEGRVGKSVSTGSEFLADALGIFYRLREPATGLNKRPSTAELLNWLILMRRAGGDLENPIREKPEVVTSSLTTLIKTADDQEKGGMTVADWLRDN
jgi:MoxR-like ATPase